MAKEILKTNYKKVVDKITHFLKREFKKRNKVNAILGLSGGIDSSVSAILCQRAGLNLYGIILPYKKRGEKDGKKAAEFLELPKNRIFVFDISFPVDAQIKELQKIIKLDKVDKGNIMARQRMIIQYALARRFNGLVIGTENLSEYYLGYFTLYGDQACDVSPIASLFKTQVYQLAEYLGAPDWLLKKKPTAGLWPGQTDEGEFGFTYREADEIIYLSLIKRYSKEKLIKKGFNKNLVNKVLERVKATDFKRQSPPKLLFDSI